jgi:hypothetical protein
MIGYMAPGYFSAAATMELSRYLRVNDASVRRWLEVR